MNSIWLKIKGTSEDCELSLRNCIFIFILLQNVSKILDDYNMWYYSV